MLPDVTRDELATLAFHLGGLLRAAVDPAAVAAFLAEEEARYRALLPDAMHADLRAAFAALQARLPMRA